MVVRAYFAIVLAFAAKTALAQEPVIYVDVFNRTHTGYLAGKSADTHANLQADPQEGLYNELLTVKGDALALYTDFASRAAREMKNFAKNMTGFADDVIQSMGGGNAYGDPDECWLRFRYHVKKIENDAQRSAVYSAESHHKFLLGHMIVFRMHLNKSEDYIKKCEKAVRGCGYPCESTPRVKRWRRLAMEEIHRVRDDIQNSRKYYRDLVSHARRKLHHLRKQALVRSTDAVQQYKNCIRG